MHFMNQEGQRKDYEIPSLATLSSSMRLLQRYEFKNNHGEWVTTVQPNLGPGIAERVWDAIRTTDESFKTCKSVRTKLHAALTSLLGARIYPMQSASSLSKESCAVLLKCISEVRD